MLVSSLAMLVALARAGSSLFWKPGLPAPAAVADHHRLHVASIVLALGLVVSATLFARPLSAFTDAAASQLFARQAYIDVVLGARSVPPAHDVRREMRERGDAK